MIRGALPYLLFHLLYLPTPRLRQRYDYLIARKDPDSGAMQWRGSLAKIVPAELKVFQVILLASTNIPRSTLLDSDHFSIAETDISTLRRTPVLEAESAVGMELKYSLTAGTSISQEILQKPKVVKRGDLVQLVAETESILIRQQGEALQDRDY